jgi:hypothetical protein
VHTHAQGEHEAKQYRREGGSEEKLLRVSLATASVVRQTKLTKREGWLQQAQEAGRKGGNKTLRSSYSHFELSLAAAFFRTMLIMSVVDVDLVQ